MIILDMNPARRRNSLWRALLVFLCAATACLGMELREDGYHVFPGENIQDALQQAAQNKTNKVVKVHAEQYRPARKRQALIWFNHAHDGIHLEAVGSVTLTAANPEVATANAPAFPAIVNHVVYFGDGVSSNTVLKGFRITGANHFVTDKLTAPMEPDTSVPKNLFFYTDGGAIKIFGRSYPTLQNLEVIDNYACPCGAGVSIQHEGFNQSPVRIENCVFLRNRAQVTGAAIDLLAGSAAEIVNCLLVGNASNMGIDVVAERSGEPPFTNSGVLTIFENSRATVRHCTFTGNRNAVDDLGGLSTYTDCIFVDNNLVVGLPGPRRYELDLKKGAKISGCVINGTVFDPRHCVITSDNILNPVSPQFDGRHVPAAPEYQKAGYRPAE